MENKEENLVFVGLKEFKVYNYAIRKKLEKFEEVVVKTRGKHISTAVNITAFLEKKGIVVINSVKLSGEDVEKDNKTRFVPEIEIRISKK